MPCSEHAALLSRQLDEPLPAGEAFGLALHLRLCKGCRRLKAHLRRLRELARAMGQQIESGEGLPAEARARLAARFPGVNEKA